MCTESARFLVLVGEGATGAGEQTIMSKQSAGAASLRAAVLGLIALAAIATQAQAAVTWPNLSGVGACQGSLQSCIDGVAPGETVLIGADDFLLADGYTAVNEDIGINKSLTLAAADGIDAVFAPGRSITVDSPTSGAVAVTLRRLVLQHGHVALTHSSTSAGSYFVDGLRVAETDAVSECAIRFHDAGSGSAQFSAGNNVIELRDSSAAACALSAQGDGGPWQGTFSGNHIRAENSSGSIASMIRLSGTSAGVFSVSGNQIVGHGFAGGIAIDQYAGSTANTWYILSNYVSGERTGPADGFAGILVTPQNSELHVANNTVTNGTHGIFIYPPASTPDSSFGQVASNLVAFHSGGGLGIGSGLPTLGNRNNLVYANGSEGFTPGPGTLTVDPQFFADGSPRFGSASPARNAGSNADVLAPALDADGERRINEGTVDIGAFEFSGDYALVHAATVADACCNDSPINETFPQPLGITEKMLETPHHGSGDPTQLTQNIGVYLVSSSPVLWALFHENTGVPMQPGQAFSVFAPYQGYTSFVHTTTAGNIIGQYTRLPALDGGANAIAFASHNWNPGGGSGTYHDHRIGLERVGSDWFIRNEDSSVDMPAGVSFNVVVAPFFATANAFQVFATFSTSRIPLNHLLLDNNPCAAPQVTRVDNPSDPAIVFDDVPLSVQYVPGVAGAPGHWFIVAEGAGTPVFPIGAGFNVMVPGAQAGACLDDDRIFANGFDA